VNASRVLSDPISVLLLPAIVLVEACWIVERGKTSIPSPHALLETVDKDFRFRYVALNREIVDLSLSLTAIDEIHDRQIVAATLYLRQQYPSLSLITHDQMITSSGLVPVIW
jgi:hypothetical protein